ncbi:hypothetical protein SY88_17485 [Clostridiales bacterium PH28_bin88]|nr:hypothetical protein SY88_17485 [Clostridiales bacterium PH28_bin88]
MTHVRPINEARRDLSALYDEITTLGREVVVINAKSKNRDSISLVKTALLEEWLGIYGFSPEVFLDEETRTWNVHINELGLYAYADTREEAIEQAIDLVSDYTADYLERLQLFLNIPDRRKHYPYIIRISHCRNRNELQKVLELNGDL